MNTDPTRPNVRRYLQAAYLVDDEQLDTIMASPEAKDFIDRAIDFRSFAFYPGDQIAKHFGLAENPDYTEDEDDDEDDD